VTASTGGGRLIRRLGRTLGLGAAWLAVALPALGASPTPGGAPGGDPRSSGQGPGLVGDPLFAVLVVLAIGLGTLLLTLAYVRMTARRDS
jgi:hypothetical protein